MTSDSRRRASKPTAPHPDAILLWLMAEHTKAQARVEAADILLEAKPRNRLAEAKFDRLCWTVSDIEDVILAQPTHTPEGLGIKARIAARYMQAPEDRGWRTYEVLGHFVQEIMCWTGSGRPEASSVVMRHRTTAGRG